MANPFPQSFFAAHADAGPELFNGNHFEAEDQKTDDFFFSANVMDDTAASEAQNWPYNESLTNATNASIAAAQAGRTNRSHGAGGINLPRYHSIFKGITQSPTKVLDILRQSLQVFINQELHAVLEKYMKDCVELAVTNIRLNEGADSVNDDILNSLRCSMLEEAKKMYVVEVPSLNSSMSTAAYPSTGSPYSVHSDAVSEPFARYGARRRSRDSDGDSFSSDASSKRIRVDKPTRIPKVSPLAKKTTGGSSQRMWSSVIDVGKIDNQTKFMLGSAANKVVGYAAARGRIYVKHPDLFKYVGDQEDKQWLYENNIMTAAGGKAFLVFAEDIREILRSDTDQSVRRGSMAGVKEFTIPPFMLKKVQAAAASYDVSEARSRSGSGISNISPASPSPTEPEETETETVQKGGDNVDGRFDGEASPASGLFSPLNDPDAFGGDNNVFSQDDHEFSSLDAINPTIGHDSLEHLDF
ncbi:hypothetical protein RvY_08559 [Ramazzottius varieornatus]|uniref:Uncharacterized protein n=1 Tax=Ramazzottius varieornatus TaxID=947166 RepID=A0A1D1V687_RAMVA|nr:hypothetical protein RvY_08559 [Ramazzottius varieornatus]